MEIRDLKMEKLSSRSPIKSYKDLIVYQNLYKAMILVHTKIIPLLPKDEKFGLADQMRRASQAGPALIAEGFAKRYQKRQWLKYLNDAMGESNEMQHHLSVCIDVYAQYVDTQLCKDVRDIYEITCKQLTKLGQCWKNYHDE